MKWWTSALSQKVVPFLELYLLFINSGWTAPVYLCLTGSSQRSVCNIGWPWSAALSKKHAGGSVMFQSPCQIVWSNTRLRFTCLRLGHRFCDICNSVAMTADSEYSPNMLNSGTETLTGFLQNLAQRQGTRGSAPTVCNGGKERIKLSGLLTRPAPVQWVGNRLLKWLKEKGKLFILWILRQIIFREW